MKRNVLLAILFALAFMACKKDKDIVSNPPPAVKQDPTLKRDSTYPNKIIIVPKIDTVIGSIILDTKDAQGMTAIGSSVKFAFTGAFKPSDDLRNVYYVVKDAGTVVFTSENKLTVSDAVNSFTQTPFLSFTQAKVYVVEVHADVLSSATDNTGADDQCTITFDLVYQANGSATNKTLSATGQILTFRQTAASTVAVTRDPSDLSQSNWTFISGEEFEESKVNLVSTGGASILTALEFAVVGDPNVRSGISTVKVYEGATPIGTAAFSSYLATVSLNFILPEGVTKTLPTHLIVGQVNDLVSSGTGAQTIELILTKVRYTDAGGTPKVINIGLQSNKFSLLKSKQVVTSIPLSGILQNGVLGDGYKFKIESIGSTSSNKIFAFEIKLTDNGPNLDTLYYKNMYVKVNNALYSARITNSSDQIIDSVGPGNSKVYVTFVSGSGEVVTNPGPGTEFTIGGRWVGFNHPSNGDVASIVQDTTRASVPYTYRYANSGTAPNNLTGGVYSSPIANSGVIRDGHVWNDFSATGHSFIFGAATMDAKTSSIGVKFNVTAQVWHQ